jgi:hypothetical protein
MGRRRETIKGKVLAIDDFRLTERQRAFHDAYVEGRTMGNAHASALAVGYAETSAKNMSHRWVPGSGNTVESIGTAMPIAQAIFWTLRSRAEIRREIEARTTERTIEQRVVSRQYIEKNLMEIVERCMGHELHDEKGCDLAARLADGIVDEINLPPAKRKDVSALIAKRFKEYASSHRVFRPTQAKEAMRLLGIDIGMFITRWEKVPETPVDNLTPAQLVAERERLSREWENLQTEMGRRKTPAN